MLMDGRGRQRRPCTVFGRIDAPPAKKIAGKPYAVGVGDDADHVTGRQRSQSQQPIGTGDEEVDLSFGFPPAALQVVQVGIEHLEGPIGDLLWACFRGKVPPVGQDFGEFVALLVGDEIAVSVVVDANVVKSENCSIRYNLAEFMPLSPAPVPEVAARVADRPTAGVRLAAGNLE